MVFEVLNFLDGNIYKFSSYDYNYDEPYLNFCNIKPFIGSDGSVNLGFEDSHEYGLFVDNSTNSVGITIQDLTVRTHINIEGVCGTLVDTEIGLPLYMLNITRTTRLEPDDRSFTPRLMEFIDGLLRRKDSNGNNYIRVAMFESPFFSKRKSWSSMSYEKLMSVKREFEKVVKKYPVDYISVPPQSWKSVYLTPFKQELNLNLTKSNKNEIRQIAFMYIFKFPQLSTVHGFEFNIVQSRNTLYMSSAKTDMFDSFGMSVFYNENIFRADKIKKIDKTLPKYTSYLDKRVYIYRKEPIRGLKSTMELLEVLREEARRIHGHDIPILQFEYCNDMSLEDNLRAALHYGNNLCVAYASLSIQLIIELYDYEQDILKPDDYLFVAGYRLS